jgi:hypothetical protein
MDAEWWTFAAAVAAGVIRALFVRSARSKALRQAAANTPGMVEAREICGDRERDRQHALHGFELWTYKLMPNGEIRRPERPALTPVTYAERKSRELEPPNVEDPAA